MTLCVQQIPPLLASAESDVRVKASLDQALGALLRPARCLLSPGASRY
jgi:hypothetical protein